MTGSEIYSSYKLPLPDQVPCPGCSYIIPVVAHAQTVFLGCQQCGRKISYSKDSAKAVSQPLAKKLKSVIPLGTKGKLKEILWQVIAFAQYREHQRIYTWKEYTLFNPIHGYAILSEYDGHWNYIRPTDHYSRPKSTTKTIEVEGKSYSAYHQYKSQFIAGIGEFNWDITEVNLPAVTEFIAPPYALVKEINRDSLCWYLAEYIEPKIIASVFNIKESLPPRQGKGSIQVSAATSIHSILKKVSLAFLALMLLLQILFSLSARNAPVFSEYYDLTDTTAKAPFVTSSFTLGNSFSGAANLDFFIKADVSNNWFEAATTLINDDTGEEYYFEAGVEEYHGYDEGAWSEGSNNDDKILSNIPDGRYHLNITPNAGPSYGNALPVKNFSIKVIRDVPSWKNYFFITCMILLILVINWIRMTIFESGRWMNSEFYETE
jgi:hypothetical protein